MKEISQNEAENDLVAVSCTDTVTFPSQKRNLGYDLKD